MKTKKDKTILKVMIIFYVFYVLLSVVMLYIFMDKDKKIPVKSAISYPKALLKVMEDDYYIVHSGYCFDGKRIYPVYLTGKNYNKMYNNGNPALFSAGNKFLVKGRTEDISFDSGNPTELYVEEWDIIAPIKRNYYYDGYDCRLFYPLSYIDSYDVARGDYIPDTVGDCVLTETDAECFLEDKENYFLVSPEMENGEVKWYLCSEPYFDSYVDLDEQVELSGNLPPEEYQKFYVTMYYDYTDNYVRNYILLQGKKNEYGIFVEQWWFTDVIYRGSDNIGGIHSAYFFDERDFEE